MSREEDFSSSDKEQEQPEFARDSLEEWAAEEAEEAISDKKSSSRLNQSCSADLFQSLPSNYKTATTVRNHATALSSSLNAQGLNHLNAESQRLVNGAKSPPEDFKEIEVEKNKSDSDLSDSDSENVSPAQAPRPHLAQSYGGKDFWISSSEEAEEDERLTKSYSYFSFSKPPSDSKPSKRGLKIGARLCPPRPASLPTFTFLKKNEGFTATDAFIEEDFNVVHDRLTKSFAGQSALDQLRRFTPPKKKNTLLSKSYPEAALRREKNR